MPNPIFPPSIDNRYRGHKVALWLFGLLVSFRTLQSLMVLFDAASVARSADGIPLDTYPAASAQTIVALFALSGLYRLILLLVCVVVLLRYRSAVPFLFALLALEYAAKRLLLLFVPIASTGTPIGPLVNLVLFALTIIGLALSLWNRGTRRADAVTMVQ